MENLSDPLELKTDELEALAEQLHKDYRATAKHMGLKGAIAHDHGFIDCGNKKKQYFIKRARMLLKQKGKQI